MKNKLNVIKNTDSINTAYIMLAMLTVITTIRHD